MELIALDGDAHQGLIRQPEGQAVGAVGFVGFGLGEWRSLAAELRRIAVGELDASILDSALR